MKNFTTRTILLYFRFLCKVFIFLVAFSGNTQEQKNRKKQITISGTVVDKASNTPLEYATIAFLNTRLNKTIGGGITDGSGNFSIEIPAGNYTISVEYISFKTKVLKGQRLVADTVLGTIVLEIDSEALDDVVVVAEKTTVEIRLDKKIYNVGKDLTIRGGTVSDVLDNVPSVSVDVDGNVALRGNDNVRILINGKPSGLVGLGSSDALRQLPAESIERVEVITAPSARYDAEGTGGILNIILKRSKLQGLNGAITLNARYPLGAGVSGNLNYRTGAWNFFTTTGYNYRERPGTGTSRTEYFNNDQGAKFLDERRDFDRSGLSFNTNIGVEWYINETASFTNSLFIRSSDENNISTNIIEDLDSARTVLSSRNRIDNEKELDVTKQYAANFTKNFNTSGHKLTFDFQIERSAEDENSIITQNNLAFDELVTTVEEQNRILLQSDYVLPLGENAQFELGYRGNFNTLDTDYVVATELENSITINDSLTNNLVYREYVNAVYSQYGNKKGKFSFLLGLRVESSRITIDQKTTGDFSRKKYTDLFPTLNLGFEFTEDKSITLGYNRRIRRPRSRFINPFPSRSSATNLFQGNPDLDPVYSNALDLGYLQKLGKWTLNTSIYYNRSTQSFSFIAIPTGDSVVIGINEDGSSNIVPVIQRSPINLSTEERFGFEFTTTYNPTRNWRINGNFNGFMTKTRGSFQNQSLDAENLSWFARLNNKLTLPGDISWQTTFNYFGPRRNAQVESKGIYSANMAFSKDFFKEKATVTLNANDLFNGRKYRSISETIAFRVDSEFQRRLRSFTIAFSYRFNQKKKRDRGDRENSSGDGDYEG